MKGKKYDVLDYSEKYPSYKQQHPCSKVLLSTALQTQSQDYPTQLNKSVTYVAGLNGRNRAGIMMSLINTERTDMLADACGNGNIEEKIIFSIRSMLSNPDCPTCQSQKWSYLHKVIIFLSLFLSRLSQSPCDRPPMCKKKYVCWELIWKLQMGLLALKSR